MDQIDWKSYSPEELDRLAWEAIRTWHHHTSLDLVMDGIDYAELVRSYLWDKVGRAIRRQVQSADAFEFELQQVQARFQPPTPSRMLPQPTTSSLRQSLKTRLQLGRLKQAYQLTKQRLDDQRVTAQLHQQAVRQQARVLYIPLISPRLQTTATALSTLPSVIAVTRPTQCPDVTTLDHVPYPKVVASADLLQAETLYQGVMRGLAALGIKLLEIDRQILQQQVVQLVERVQQVEAELQQVQPDAVLVHADNHPPHQIYVLVARRRGIPSIMVQHGLDCERYCLEDAYASAIAVWGNGRLQRYRQHSRWQPSWIRVTGNPEFNHLRLPQRLNPNGEYWLWATRPHSPEKCYLPSRTPAEGIEILEALLTALEAHPDAQLVIKAHPYDYVDLYRERLLTHPLQHRITISNLPLQSLLPDARLVITEDSTAGMEAMFLGKPVILAHFAASPPVTPYVTYGSALPAFSAAMLQAALLKIQQMTVREGDRLLHGQRAFLLEFAGACDGQALEQMMAFILEVLQSRSANSVSRSSVDGMTAPGTLFVSSDHVQHKIQNFL